MICSREEIFILISYVIICNEYVTRIRHSDCNLFHFPFSPSPPSLSLSLHKTIDTYLMVLLRRAT